VSTPKIVKTKNKVVVSIELDMKQQADALETQRKLGNGALTDTQKTVFVKNALGMAMRELMVAIKNAVPVEQIETEKRAQLLGRPKLVEE
jgi:hypothetical protein